MPKKRASSAEHAEPAVKLSSRGAARLQARHPWVYRSDIIEANDIPPGAIVRILDQRGKFLGTALYSSSSQIAIRMISHGSIADLPALVAERIRAAMNGSTTQQVNLAHPIPVLIVYATVIVLEDGVVHFYDDIYGHDESLEKVLARGYPYPQ